MTNKSKSQEEIMKEERRIADALLVEYIAKEDFINEYDYWGEHPEYPLFDWQVEVALDNTRVGYWDWVLSMVETGDEDEGEDEENPGEYLSEKEEDPRPVFHCIHCENPDDWSSDEESGGC